MVVRTLYPMRNGKTYLHSYKTADGVAVGWHPLAGGEREYQLTEFSEKYPRTARQFNVSLSGFRAWEAECALHNWLPASDLCYSRADRLTLFASSWYNNFDAFASTRFATLFAQLRQEFGAMARRAVKEQAEKRATWQGFIDFRLTNDQLAELDDWQPTPVEIWESVDRLLGDKYRVTLSYSAKLKTATCSIMDDDPMRKSGGWALSSADGDGASALKAAIYKHFLVLNGSWETVLDIPASVGRRG